MTRISQADHVLLLLREQLQKIGRSRKERTGRAAPARGATPRPIARLQAMGSLEEGEEFRRTLVRAILTEEMGEAMANDPSFQAVVDNVYRMISATPDGQELIDRAGRQLRGGS
ncbi:MAG: hypothetical protein QOJ27_1029 [Sphingomonadales bacterium]|nr:hypothetical protein [Sphingomonadales bacterium]